MRSERRKEIIAQMEANKKAKRRQGVNAFCRLLSIIYTILAAAFVGMLAWLDVLPEKYFLPAVIGLAVASLFIVPVMFSKNGKTGRKIGATFVAIVLIGVFGVGSWYIYGTIDFLDQITAPKEVTEDFHVLVNADALYEGVADLYAQTVGTNMATDMKYSEAKAVLEQEAGVVYAYDETVAGALIKLRDGEYPAIFISAASYELLKADDPELETKVKILHTIKMKVETEDVTDAVDVTKEPFNVYISGIDIEGNISTVSRTDVNMIATVNPVSNEVLLTSIPRDYYVNLPTKQAPDKLTHSGLYGVQETIGAVEDVIGIDINYYVRVNYTTVVKLVDALGGIQV
ncbi:MAG: LCP family protein, partial [Firmicutes bacterium]|nr:LCP family protein [Bacillota bacterium]